MSRRRIGICFPLFRPGGGAEASALWAVEALKDEYALTLISAGRVSLSRLNACYGTRIAKREIRVVEIPLPNLVLCTFATVRGALLNRYCLRHAPEYEAMISAYNVMDFGRRGIQLIADFSFDSSLRKAYGDLPLGWRRGLYEPRLLRSAYVAASRLLAGTGNGGWRKNLTVANSRWTRDVIGKAFGIAAEVVYPPVVEEKPPRPWKDQDNGFVYLGRVSFEKRIERIIEILAAVRVRRPDIHLHIVGGASKSYLRSIEPLLRRNRDWVYFEGPKFMAEKSALIDAHRYGISARANEPFGIAVAEMVQSGNLVFVPEGGGQVEIVDHPDLIYENPGDAAAKIAAILDSPARQKAVRDHLLSRRGRFSPARYMAEVRKLVRGFFSDGASS